ncbi:MAG: S-methyl-5-thioribose-1-phosphate isomerase [Bacillota bacterium]
MFPAIEMRDDRVLLLDQRRLPSGVEFLECTSYQEVAWAIRNMVVRGAPAIGIAAAYGMVLAAQAAGEESFWEALETAAAELKATRPTAVNLFWAVNRMLRKARDAGSPQAALPALKDEAARIAGEDLAMNLAIGEHGYPLVPDGARVLTHCNAGALATGGFGTALGVIRRAVERGRRVHVYADETRPLLQGARLTAWELMQDQIPVTLVTDGMAGHLMQAGRVDLVLVGADRIAANGDVANKIGTYGLAVLAWAHGVPFYVAAPASTIDLSLPHGSQIIIEERDPSEVAFLGNTSLAPEGVRVYNPAFDVTPARYVTALITDRGVLRPPLEHSLKESFRER